MIDGRKMKQFIFVLSYVLFLLISSQLTFNRMNFVQQYDYSKSVVKYEDKIVLVKGALWFSMQIHWWFTHILRRYGSNISKFQAHRKNRLNITILFALYRQGVTRIFLGVKGREHKNIFFKLFVVILIHQGKKFSWALTQLPCMSK